MKSTIFGSAGLLGSELVLTSPLNTKVKALTSKDINLIDIGDKTSLFDYNDLWINAAAKVGGVAANTNFVANFFDENILIGSNVIHQAHKTNVKKLISILSTCIYPDADYVKYPLTEDQLHNGPPHHSNFGYAYAKRMLDVQSRAYRQQHHKNFITVVPNNLYGLQDNYDLNNGHVIPSLIRKFFEAQKAGNDVIIWGTGKPLREFTFARDAAKVIWWCAEHYNEPDPVNIGCNDEISIGDLANLIAKIIGFKNQIKFDKTKPDGQYRKPSSNKKLFDLGCNIKYTSLEDGLTETISFFEREYFNLRGIK
jgi:GDP-L-fucose synthase